MPHSFHQIVLRKTSLGHDASAAVGPLEMFEEFLQHLEKSQVGQKNNEIKPSMSAM
jgi:hypothetical protein